MKNLGLAVVGLAVWAAAAIVAAGCGTSAASICSRVCECVGCSRSEEDDCVDDFEDLEQDAQEEGCSDEHAAWIACVDQELTCDDDEIDADGCENEAEDLGECLDGPTSTPFGSFGGGGCDELAERARDCGYSVDEGYVCDERGERCASCLLASAPDFCDPEDLLRASEQCQASGDC